PFLRYGGDRDTPSRERDPSLPARPLPAAFVVPCHISTSIPCRVRSRWHVYCSTASSGRKRHAPVGVRLVGEPPRAAIGPVPRILRRTTPRPPLLHSMSGPTLGAVGRCRPPRITDARQPTGTSGIALRYVRPVPYDVPSRRLKQRETRPRDNAAHRC